jgi:hypothetical protein
MNLAHLVGMDTSLHEQQGVPEGVLSHVHRLIPSGRFAEHFRGFSAFEHSVESSPVEELEPRFTSFHFKE